MKHKLSGLIDEHTEVSQIELWAIREHQAAELRRAIEEAYELEQRERAA